MSFTKHCSIWCDATDCQGWIGEEDTVADARRIARKWGWKRRNGRDYCPEHSGERQNDHA